MRVWRSRSDSKREFFCTSHCPSNFKDLIEDVSLMCVVRVRSLQGLRAEPFKVEIFLDTPHLPR
jgi:hypothetical protein